MIRPARCIVGVVLFGLVCARPMQAHFVWLVPCEAGDKNPAVRLFFSEEPGSCDSDLLKKIAQTEVFVRNTGEQTRTIKPVLTADEFKAALPGETFREVGAVCRYGVVKHGSSEPFLLNYYAKAFVGIEDGTHPPAAFARRWDRLALEIVPLLPAQGPPRLRVLWQGKPLADAEVVLAPPGSKDSVKARTDKEGRFSLPAAEKGGLYGIRAVYKEGKEGELQGKKYKEVRHYTTLVLRVPERRAAAKADAAATKLLADARAARTLYHDFPGFTADVAINLDGKTTHGSVQVSDKGKVTLKVGNADAEKWAKSTLASIIAHRLSGGPDEETPCAFADDDEHHPLGRAIRVLNDEFHSSYRIRDRQVIVVNRHVPGARFTITVMENVRTKEKKFLPACYVVNTWDAKTDALTSSETHHQTWQRIGAFDLPKETLAVKATAGKLDARSLKFSNVHLLKSQ